MTLIRDLHTEDIPALTALAHVSVPLACPPDTKREDIDQHLDAVYSPGNLADWLANPALELRGAFSDEQLVGLLMLGAEASPVPVPASRSARELSKLYVHPSAHGQGIAATLLADARARARTQGHDALWLSTSKSNARALAFYRKQGFREFGERQFWVGNDPQPDWLLVLPLD
ncbi:GNAT family N-acetyltransferase [Arenimonas oryziterrae]|uniref:N-acetyltransferase domain-containing protein n=1 Tax=Arenimonas oryziterrae DSM 21050 = YC6267 TaxID=1121015 RepID=A0A091B993_9GAMM|nr:GNAT family N-acetyltransferase [Arenimonas oryziterrae]KFN41000.1 hypothetical protein N789_03720 [Arenimonas oryziterrae DSM 21050 = YC6267]